jgi:hypothetical protein
MPTPLQFPADFAQSPTAALGTAVLDGVIYRLRFWPNVRANDGQGAWYVDLYSVVGVPSVLAVKLILSTDLFGSYRTTTALIPPGRLVVRRTDTVNADPRPTRRDEIGAKVATLGSPLLVVEYVSVAEETT